MLRTMHEAYKVARLGGRTLSPLRALYLSTPRCRALPPPRGPDRNFETGRDGDFIVLDWAATPARPRPPRPPLMARRTARAASLAEKLFVMIMLGDDRASRRRT